MESIMNSQTLTIAVLGAVPLSHTTTWTADVDAPSCSVEMPRASSLSINAASIGKVAIDGDIEFDPAAAAEGRRVLRWSAAAQARNEGSGSITLSHPNDDFEDVEISLEMSDEAALSVDEEESLLAAMPGASLIKLYGSYASGFLGAFGALIFALLMPAHQTELVSAAGAIALWTCFASEVNEPFGLRVVLFLAAAVAMVFAMIMPANAENIMEAAGLMCAAAIFWGDEWI